MSLEETLANISNYYDFTPNQLHQIPRNLILTLSYQYQSQVLLLLIKNSISKFL